MCLPSGASVWSHFRKLSGWQVYSPFCWRNVSSALVATGKIFQAQIWMWKAQVPRSGVRGAPGAKHWQRNKWGRALQVFIHCPPLVEESRAPRIASATALTAPHRGLAPMVSTGCFLKCLPCSSFCEKINRILIILHTVSPTCAHQLGPRKLSSHWSSSPCSSHSSVWVQK